MNKSHNIFVEIIITFIAASVVSLIAYFSALAFLQLFNMTGEEVVADANIFGSVVFGFAVGYRMNDVRRSRQNKS